MKRAARICAGLVLCAGLLAPGAACASTEDFTVVGVGVDVSLEQASAKALDFARKRAVYLAIKKLGYANASALASQISPENMGKIIRGANITQTRRIETKTYAEVEVTIVDEALAKVLSTKSAPQAVPTARDAPAVRTVLVLPVLVLPERTYVWEKDNALRPPLSNALLLETHGLVILPGGDLQDLRLIDRDNMRKVTSAELKPMFERYGADEIVIAIATPAPAGSNAPTTVLLRRLTPARAQEETLSVPVPEAAEATSPAAPPVRIGTTLLASGPAAAKTAAPHGNKSAVPEVEALSPELTKVLIRTAQSIAKSMLEIATSSTAIERGQLELATQIPLRFDYTIPKQLGMMTDIVRTAPGVLQLALPEIALNHVEATAYIEGDKEVLRKAILDKGLKIRMDSDRWVISVR